MQKDLIHLDEVFSGAGNEARTRYLHLGKVALYQMSYARIRGKQAARNEYGQHFTIPEKYMQTK